MPTFLNISELAYEDLMSLVDITIKSTGFSRCAHFEPEVVLCTDGFGVCCRILDPNDSPIAVAAVEINESQLQTLSEVSELLAHFSAHRHRATKTLKEFVAIVTSRQPSSAILH